jgi:hypothetical protein
VGQPPSLLGEGVPAVQNILRAPLGTLGRLNPGGADTSLVGIITLVRKIFIAHDGRPGTVKETGLGWNDVLTMEILVPSNCVGNDRFRFGDLAIRSNYLAIRFAGSNCQIELPNRIAKSSCQIELPNRTAKLS